MTGEQPNKFKYDANILGYAQVAAEYLNQGTEEGVALAGKSLELILKDIRKTQELPNWMTAHLADPEEMHKTIKSQLEDYNEFKGKQTIGDLTKQYSNDISRYLGNNTEVAKNVLEGFKDEKYTDMLKKMGKAKYILDGKKNFGIGSDEDVAGAEKTIKKYSNIIKTFTRLERQYLKRFRDRVEDEIIKEEFNEMYPKPEELAEAA